MAKNTQTYFTGNKGKVWVDNEEILTITKGSIKEKYEYEEVNSQTGLGKKRVKIGTDYDVELTYKDIGGLDLNEIFDDSKDIDVIMANSNTNEKKVRRVKAINVTWDERTYIDFERKKVGERTLTGKCESVEELQ